MIPDGRWCEIPRKRPGRTLVQEKMTPASRKPKMRHWIISAFGGSGSSVQYSIFNIPGPIFI
jgi:hypothetical protein